MRATEAHYYYYYYYYLLLSPALFPRDTVAMITFLYFTYTTEFPPRISGFLGNTDLPSSNTVRMTEGLLYFPSLLNDIH